MFIGYLLFLCELLVNALYILFFVRMMGKKEIKQSTPLDFGYMVLLASIAWDMTLEGKYNLFHSFAAMLILSLLIAGLDWLTFKSKKVNKVFVGEPTEIIKDGQMNKEIMEKHRMSEEELLSSLRTQGVFDIETVKLGVLEVDGLISVKQHES